MTFTKIVQSKSFKIKKWEWIFLKNTIHKFSFFYSLVFAISVPFLCFTSLCSSIVLLKSGDMKKSNLRLVVSFTFRFQFAAITFYNFAFATWQSPFKLTIQFLTSQLFHLQVFFCLWMTGQLKINNLQFIFQKPVLCKVLGG